MFQGLVGTMVWVFSGLVFKGQGHSDGDVRNGGVSHWDHSGPFGPKWDLLENAILGSESCALGVRCWNIASVGLCSRGKLPAMRTR